MRKEEANVQIKQIAEAAGFSQSTVSIVLNGRGEEMRISKETQQKIINIAKEMNYQPNIFARRLRSGFGAQTSQMIGVFWNEGFNEEIGAFINGAYEYFASENLNCELVVKPFQASKLHLLKDSFSSQIFNGIIIGGMSREDVLFLEMHQFDVPIILSGTESKKYSHIAMDGYALGMECAEIMARSHIKTAAYMGTMNIGSHSSMRESGFTSGCRMNGITVLPEWLIHMERMNAVNGYNLTKKLLQMKNRPEAVFINYDSVAIGMLLALLESCVRTPEDMKVIVYGYNEILQHTAPSLTMVAYPMKRLGFASAELVMLLIKNSIDIVIMRKVEPEIFWGDSLPDTGCPTSKSKEE